MRRTLTNVATVVLAALLATACTGGAAPFFPDGGVLPETHQGQPAGGSDSDADSDGDIDTDSDTDVDTDEWIPTGGCGFDYDSIFTAADAVADQVLLSSIAEPLAAEYEIAHAEPQPAYTYTARTRGPLPDDIVMPGYDDDMPLFERGAEWAEDLRCYETPLGAFLLTQPQAHALWVAIAEATTGVMVDQSPGVRTVVGLRGAYPGTFAWHGNAPDRFNDTLALLWIDGGGEEHVREFPVHTDVGAHDFGFESSSSLRPNRRYHHVNGWHSTYNALHIDEWGYAVRDDTNHNGHWDSDRNGWLPPYTAEDYDRSGSGHNIHMGSVDAPLGTAAVGVWSAGCQVVPGMANWTEFITSAWTQPDDPVSYFLVDARDIAPEIWEPCEPDGSHACPYRIAGFPFEHEADTSTVATSDFDFYSCSGLDESGPEVVYVLTVDSSGTLTAAVDCEDPVVDVDVHLLDADDADACLARDHWSLSHDITPGRYFVVVDTWFDGVEPLSGPFSLSVTFD